MAVQPLKKQTRESFDFWSAIAALLGIFSAEAVLNETQQTEWIRYEGSKMLKEIAALLPLFWSAKKFRSYEVFFAIFLSRSYEIQPCPEGISFVFPLCIFFPALKLASSTRYSFQGVIALWCPFHPSKGLHESFVFSSLLYPFLCLSSMSP